MTGYGWTNTTLWKFWKELAPFSLMTTRTSMMSMKPHLFSLDFLVWGQKHVSVLIGTMVAGRHKWPFVLLCFKPHRPQFFGHIGSCKIRCFTDGHRTAILGIHTWWRKMFLLLIMWQRHLWFLMSTTLVASTRCLQTCPPTYMLHTDSDIWLWWAQLCWSRTPYYCFQDALQSAQSMAAL